MLEIKSSIFFLYTMTVKRKKKKRLKTKIVTAKKMNFFFSEIKYTQKQGKKITGRHTLYVFFLIIDFHTYCWNKVSRKINEYFY